MPNDMNFFRGLFKYDYWANRAALESLQTVHGVAERPLKLFDHIIGAERVWLSRFESPNSPITEPWPALTAEQARTAVEELQGRWDVLLKGLTPEKLAGDLTYRNTKGVEFRTPIRDVLMHLVMHSVYHRGQVAAAVREAGGEPAATDYVVYVRQTK
jgi:uncharacterized damage-inducible protein DinB